MGASLHAFYRQHRTDFLECKERTSASDCGSPCGPGAAWLASPGAGERARSTRRSRLGCAGAGDGSRRRLKRRPESCRTSRGRAPAYSRRLCGTAGLGQKGGRAGRANWATGFRGPRPCCLCRPKASGSWSGVPAHAAPRVQEAVPPVPHALKLHATTARISPPTVDGPTNRYAATGPRSRGTRACQSPSREINNLVYIEIDQDPDTSRGREDNYRLRRFVGRRRVGERERGDPRFPQHLAGVLTRYACT
jgi:hypothetical protein